MTKIMIVGESLSEEAAHRGDPCGPMLTGLLRQAGISREDCFITNVFNFPVSSIDDLLTTLPSAGYPNWPPFKPKHWLHNNYARSLDELHQFRHELSPNIIIALGDVAMWALTHRRGVKKQRGAPMETFDGKHKVIVTWNPGAITKQWELRPIVLLDLQKAEVESAYPEVRRTPRILHLYPTLADIESFYHDYILPSSYVSCDIETKNMTITEVGFAPSEDRALVIPFWSREARDGNYWATFEEERAAWRWVARILRERPQLGQNFQYDMAYFYRAQGIPAPNFAGDTMLLHHTLQPELEKGLGFLGSIYTNEPAWKLMRQADTLKREE